MRKHNPIGGSAAFLAALALAAAPAPAAPAESAPAAAPLYSTRSSVDWKSRVMTVEVELDLASAGLRMPQGRLEAERMLDRDLPGLAKDAVLSLRADSHRTVGDAASEGAFDPERLVALASLARPAGSHVSRDMRKYVASFELGLEAVSALFLSGADPARIRAPIDARPSREYTGIVIYAAGSLPVHGEALEGEASPCLFPRIYDDSMRLVLDRSMVAPEVLAAAGPSGGVLGYADALGAEASERVGGDPLRVMALGLFGDARTDLIVSRDDALRMASSPGNRDLLREGRVVVVLGR